MTDRDQKNDFRLDPAALRQAIERACDIALRDYRQFRGEEAYHRAGGRIEGILSGAAAVLRSLEGEGSESLLEAVRILTFRASGDLVRLSEED